MSATYPEPIVEFLGGDPTPEQWRAISWPLEPCVVVAGAGSGKTSVMAARVIYLAMVATGAWQADHPGVMPGDVLCLTFTNKATENLMIRIRRALRTLDLPEGEEPEILNYHAFAAQVLERNGMLIGLEPGVRVLSQAQKTEIAARVLDRMTFDEQHTRWQPAIVGYITDLDEQLANHLVEPEDVVEHVQGKLEALRNAPSDEPFRAGLERIEIARAVRVFRDLKAELGVIDFGDQIAHAVRIVSERPEVGATYRERFGAVLLDEYQDTNHAQAALMRGVFGSAHPVTAVGDPDQNIYAWRGASLRNLLEFPVEFRRADGSESARLPLYTNFRSGAQILGAADRVIGALPAAQRPDPDKVLRPWEPNGEGAVWVAHFEHEISEAEGIADAIAHLHETGTAWKDCAVLCRTHRLFEALQLAFNEKKVPAEFVNLTGLIHLPEVVELLAYARAAEDPADGVALARILTGPRFRIGLRDLARVAAWSRRSTAAFIQALDELELREDEDLLEDHPFLMAEALEHLDDVEGLSDAGRERLDEFRAELAELRSAARRPVGEFLAEIIRRTGLLAELDAAVDVEMASARRRNLAAFLEQVHAFQPVEGELTLRAFLDHVDAIEDDREWTPVQPSEDDSVKVMTVHAAKGLEFDNVYVPGLARGLFPDVRIQQNPTRKGSSLDVELRRDRDLLPTFQGNMKAFTDELRNQEEYEERRICYVALTRARRRLFVSSANWYGEAHRAKGMGPFFIELKRWGEQAGAHVTFEGGGEDDRDEERSQTNPLAGYRQRFVRPWPGPARPDDADELFAEGWRRAAAEAAGAGRVPDARIDGLEEPERVAFAEASAARRTLAAHLVAQESAMDEAPAGPSSVSVGGLIGYARCPKLYYWSAVRPLPTFAGPSARIGTEIHRWIEMKSRGQATLLELEDEPDVTAEELAGTPGRLEDLRQAYVRSRFGDMVPLYAERPFLLPIEGVTIKGRIDAIYGAPDGPWEVVDYKTGRLPSEDDPLARVQLDLYALACIEVWHKAPEDLRLTYLYLSSGQERSHTIDDVDAVRRRIGAWLRGIGAGEFEPTPGEQCRWCDFRAFCSPGQAWYEASATS
ncbi:MAG TPA: ATP-dependent DNA helicase [Actinomycetota bacterium]|nr:ATP-dependent DNA helicase [Actinomycetota bacterium]